MVFQVAEGQSDALPIYVEVCPGQKQSENTHTFIKISTTKLRNLVYPVYGGETAWLS
jgi:hypothetical protein